MIHGQIDSLKTRSAASRALAVVGLALAAALTLIAAPKVPAWADEGAQPGAVPIVAPATAHKTITVDGLEIFYREAGPADAPAIVLLHGFPTSSQMFRNLIPALADRFHVIAPDYPGFGRSAMPSNEAFEYTFDNLASVMGHFIAAKGIDRYSLYLMDYGGPVGFRLAVRQPERIETLIVQNANAYEEGLREFWQPFRAYWAARSDATAEPLRGFFKLEATLWQWTHGTRDAEAISPDTWIVDQYHLDRSGNAAIQLQLFYDYDSNLARYPEWQAYFRAHQPPMLIVWGRNDFIFPADGA